MGDDAIEIDEDDFWDRFLADRHESTFPRPYRPSGEIMRALRIYVDSLGIPDADPDEVQALIEAIGQAQLRPKPTVKEILEQDWSR